MAPKVRIPSSHPTKVARKPATLPQQRTTMVERHLDLFRDKLVLLSEDICPAKIFDAAVKRHPDGIDEKWFEASLPEYVFEAGMSSERRKAQDDKVKVRPGLDNASTRVTRSRARMSSTVSIGVDRAGLSNLDGTSDHLTAIVRGMEDAPSAGLGVPDSVFSLQLPPAGEPGPGPGPAATDEMTLSRYKGYSPLVAGHISRSSDGSDGSAIPKITLGEPALAIKAKRETRHDSISPKSSAGRGQKTLAIRLRLKSSNESLRDSSRINNSKNDTNNANRSRERDKTRKRSPSPPPEPFNGSLKKIAFYSSSSESPELAAASQGPGVVAAGAADTGTVRLCADGFNARGVKRFKFSDPSPESEARASAINHGADAVALRLRPGRGGSSDQVAGNVVRQEAKSPSCALVCENERAGVEIIDLTGLDDDDKDDDYPSDQAPKVTEGMRPKADPKQQYSCQGIKQEEQATASRPTGPVGREDETTSKTTGSSNSTLTEIDDKELAHLERCHAEYVRTTSTGSAAGPPVDSSETTPRDSAVAVAATAGATATTNKTNNTEKTTTTTAAAAAAAFPRFIVLDAQTWNLRAFHTAAHARARCQEHPVPSSSSSSCSQNNRNKRKSNGNSKKVRSRRNARLAVGAPIDMGHGGMQLLVHDAAHNSAATALMNTGVAAIARKWDGRMARAVVFGRERRCVGEWVRARGLVGVGGIGDDDDDDDDDDEKEAADEEAKGKGGQWQNAGVSPLWYQIRAKVAELRRFEGHAIKEEERDVEMADAE